MNASRVTLNNKQNKTAFQLSQWKGYWIVAALNLVLFPEIEMARRE